MSKFATPPPATESNMSQVIDDATSAMPDAYDDTLLDTIVPLGEFLDEQIARVNAETDDISESDEIIETVHYDAPTRPSSPRYELTNIPEGYVMEGEVARDFLACKDRDDLKKLLCKWKEKIFEC
ncbi:hypothetical protein ZWY2020_031514 [Hordeum vulgare]|nr:hypothetical protein ZWY2020_031514 [Hordeum vulgare]